MVDKNLIEQVIKIFNLGKVGRKLLTQRLKLEKIREKEREDFINLLKLWIKKWKGV